MEDADIEKIYRLGRRYSEKDRPLIVGLKGEYEKWEIIKKSKDLREATDQRYKKVRIGVDMTRKEREENAKLREEEKAVDG